MIRPRPRAHNSVLGIAVGAAAPRVVVVVTRGIVVRADGHRGRPRVGGGIVLVLLLLLVQLLHHVVMAVVVLVHVAQMVLVVVVRGGCNRGHAGLGAQQIVVGVTRGHRHFA